MKTITKNGKKGQNTETGQQTSNQNNLNKDLKKSNPETPRKSLQKDDQESSPSKDSLKKGKQNH